MIYMYVYIYIYIYTHVCVHIYIYICIHTGAEEERRGGAKDGRNKMIMIMCVV